MKRCFLLGRSLRARLVLLVAAAIVPLFCLSIIKAWHSAEHAIGHASSDLQFSAALVAANQSRIADSAVQLLTSMATLPGMAQSKSADCQRYFVALNEQFEIYSNLGLIGADGRLRCHGQTVQPGQIGAYAGDRSYFRDAVASGETVFSGFMVGRSTGRAVVTFARPVPGAAPGTEPAGVVFASVDLKELSRSIRDVPLPAGGRITITDHRGTVLAVNPADALKVGEMVPNPYLQKAALAMSTGVSEVPDEHGDLRIVAYTPAGVPGKSSFLVAVSADRGDVIAPVRWQLAVELLVQLLVAVFGGWIAWLMGGRAILRPANGILNATRKLRAGHLDVRLPARSMSAGSEFASIADGFNLMADSLQQRQRELGQELARNQQAYATLELTLNSMQEGLFAIDVNGRMLMGNDPARRLFDLTNDARVLNARWIAEQGLFLPGTDTPFPMDDLPLQRALRGESGGPTLVLVRNVREPRGRLFNCSYRPLMQDGGVVGALVVMADVTDVHRLQLEQAASYAELQQSEQSLRLLEAGISRLNDIVIITEATSLDEPGPRIVFVNEAFEHNTGYSREDALGRSPRFLQGPGTQRSELDRISAALLARQPVRAELINYRKNGEAFWLEIDIVPLAGTDGVTTHFVAVQRDITERKRAAQALVDSEQRYAALFETAPVPMWVFDNHTHRYLTANAAAQKSYGYSLAEFQAMSVFDIRPRSEHSRLQADLDSPDGSKDREGFWLHQRKDGSTFYATVLTQGIQYQGKPACFVVALDMTVQVEAKKEVGEHLFTLQRAADAAQAITWHQTFGGTMQEVVDQARGVIGAHQAVVSLTLDRDWGQAVNALSLSEKYAPYRTYLERLDGTGIYALVCETNKPVRLTQAELEAHPRWRGFGAHAGKHPPMRGWLAVPLLGRNGKNIGVMQLSDKYDGEFTLQDEYVALELAQLAAIAIENAQLIEEVSRLNSGLETTVAERTAALGRQEALFRSLSEQAPQVVWTISPTGDATYFNKVWFDLMGGTLEDWTGKRWARVIHPQDLAAVQTTWDHATASQTPFTGTRRVRDKEGNWHTMSYSASPVFDEAGAIAFWVGIDADITEFKAIENALRLSNQELEAFSYSVSHDLRAPLNTIDGFSRLLVKQLGGRDEEKIRHYLTRIQAGVAQMGQLIEDLLSLAQVTRMEVRSEVVDISSLSQKVLDEWQARQPARQVTVQVDEGLLAQADPRLVRVVMENLLGNAWKFTSQQAHAEIHVGQQPDVDGMPVFFVRDNGAGFDMAYAGKLFDPFQRLHAASEFPGSGIGLATVSRVIGRHGGRVWAESAPGQGATFFFTLPRVSATAEG